MSNDNTISTIQELSNLNNEVVDLLDSVTEIISNTETQSIDNRLFNTENFIFQTFIEAQARGDVVIPQRPAIRWSRFTDLIPQDAISAPQPVDQDTNSTNIILSTNSTNTITSTPETLIIPITALNTALNKPKIIAETPIETITNLNIRQEQSSIISNHFSSKNNTPLRFIYEFDPKNSVNPETASQRRIPKSTPVFTINADTSITINPDYRGIVYRILVYAVEQDKYNDVTNEDNPTYITDRNRHLSDPYTIEVQELPLPPIRLHQNIETRYNLDLSQSNVEIQFYNLFIKNIIDSTTDPVDLIYSCNISPPTSTNYNGSLLNIIRIDEGDDINDGLKITQDFRGKIDYTVTFIATDSLYKRSRELDISFHEIRPVDKKAIPNVLSNLQDRPIIISLLDHFKANTKNDLTYTSNITDITDPIPRVNVIDATDDPYVINTSDNTLQIYPDYRNDTFNITVSVFDEKYPLQPVSYVFTWIEEDAPPPIRNPLPEYDHINLGLLLETSCNFTLPEYFISRTKTHESNLEYIIHDVYDRGGNRLYQLPPTSLVDIINTLNTPPNPTLTITPKLQNKNLIHTIYVNAIDNNYNKSVIGPEKDKSKSLTITFTESESISIINTPPSIINVDTRNPITCNLLDYFQSPVPTKLGYTIKNPPNPRLSYIDSGVPPFVLNDTNDLIMFNPDFRDDEYTLSIVAFDQRAEYSQYRRQIDFNIVEAPPPSPIINTALDISLKLLPTLYTCNLNDYIVSTIGSQLTFFKDGARLFENTLTLQPKLRGSTDTFKISAKDDIYGTITENDITFHVTEFYSINQNSNIISIPTTPLTDDTIQCNLYTIFSSPINTPLHFSATSPCNLRDSYRTVDTPISAFSIDNDTGILTIAADYRDTEYRVDIVASDPEYPEQTCNISFNIVETFFPTITPIKDEIVLVTALDNTEVINLDEIFVSPYHSPDYTLSNAVFPKNPIVDIKILDEKLYYKKPFVGSDEDELTFLIQGSTYRIDRDSSLSGLSGFPSIAINDDGIQYKTFHVPVTTLSTNHPTYTYTTTGSSTTYEIKSILVDISLFTEIDNRSNLVFKNTHDNNFPNRVEINCFKQGTNIKLNDRTVTTRTVRFNLDPIYVEDLKNTPIVCNILPDPDYNYEIYNDFRVISTTLPIPVEEAPVSIINKSNIQINPDYRGDTYAVILNNDNVKALFIISEEAPIRLTDSDIFPDIYASGIEKITCNVGYLYDVNVPNCNLLIDIQYNYPVQKGFSNGGKDAVEYDPQSQDIHIYPEYREFNNDDVGYQVSLRGYVEGYRDRSVLRTFHIREDDLPPISIDSLWETVIDKETFNLSNQEYIYLDINTLYTYVFPEQIEFRVITSGIPPDFLPYPDARIENNSNIIYSAKLRNTSYNITVEAFDKTRPSNKNAELTIDVSELPPIQKHSFITPYEFSRLGRNPAEIYLSNIFTDTIPLDPYRIQYTVDVVSTVNNITSKTKGIYSESFIVEETSGVLRVYPEYRDATYDIIVIAYIHEFTNSTVSHTITNVRELEIPSLSNADPSNIDIVELGLNSGDILFSQFYKDYPYADKLILDPEDPYTVLSNTGNAAFDVSSKQGSFNVSGSLLANEYTFTLNVIDQIFDQSQRGDITVSVIETIPLTLVTDPSIPFDFPQALAESFFISISNYVKNNSDQKVSFNIIYDTDNTQFVDPTDTQYLSREGDPIIQKIVDQEGNETGITIIPDCRDISYRFKFEVFLYDGGGYKTSTNVKGQLTEYITITEDTPPPIGNIYIQDNVFNVSLKSLSNTYNISNVFRVDQDPYSAYKDDLTYTVYIDHPDTNISATVDSNAQTLTVFPDLRNISYDIYLEITDTASKLSPPDNATSNLFMSVVEARPIVSNPSASTSFHSLSNNDVVVYIRDLFINNHHENDFTFSITYNETTPSTGIHRKTPAIIENETNDTITYSSDYRGDTYTIDISAVVTGYPDFSCNITLSFEEQLLPTIPYLHTGVSSNIALITTSKTFFITDFYNLSGYPYPEDLVYTIYTPHDNCNITTSTSTLTFTIFPDLRDDTYDVYLEIGDRLTTSVGDCNVVLRITEEAPVIVDPKIQNITLSDHLSCCNIHLSNVFKSNDPLDDDIVFSNILVSSDNIRKSAYGDIEAFTYDSNNGIVTFNPDFRTDPYNLSLYARTPNYIDRDPAIHRIYISEEGTPAITLIKPDECNIVVDTILSNQEISFYVDQLYDYKYVNDITYDITTTTQSSTSTTITNTNKNFTEKVIDNRKVLSFIGDFSGDTFISSITAKDSSVLNNSNTQLTIKITEEEAISVFSSGIPTVDIYSNLTSTPQYFDLSNIFKNNSESNHTFSVEVVDTGIRDSYYGVQKKPVEIIDNKQLAIYPDYRNRSYTVQVTSTFSQWGYNSVVPIETAIIPIDETSIDLNAISFTLFDHEESDLGILVYDQECNVVLPRNYTYEFKDHLIYSFTQSNLNDESGNTDLLTSPTITNGTLKVYGDRSGINYIITVIATDNNFQIDNKEFKIKVSNLPITTLSFDSEYRLTKDPLKFDLSEYFQSVYSSFSHTISHTNLPQSYYVEQRNAVIRDGSNLAIYPEYRGEEYTITVVATNPDNIALTQTKTINIYESNLPSISIVTPTTLITPSTTQTNIGLDTITYTLDDIFDPYPFTEHLTYTITSNYDEAFITYNQDRTQLSIQGAYRNTTHSVHISASDPNYPLSSTTSADITISISECNILHTTPPVDIYTSGDTECNIYLSNFYNDLPNTDITFTVELDGGGEGGNADTSIFSYDPTDYKITLSPYYRGTSNTLIITPYILSTLERSSNTIEIHEEIIPRITLSGSSTLLFSNLISADISVDLDTLYDTTKYPYWNDVIFKVDPTSYSINTNNTFTYTASGGSKPILATITDISIKAEDSTTVFADGSRQTDTLDISIHELPILGISSGKDCNIRVNDEIFQSATSNLPYTFYDDPLFLKYATTYSSLLDATTTVSVLSPTTPTTPTTPTITPIINLDQSNIIFDIDTRGISYRIDLSVSYKDGDGTDTSYNNNEYNIFVEEKKPIDYNSTSLSITECNVKYEGGIVVGTVYQEYDISKHFILGRSECNLVVALVDSNLPDNTNYNDPSDLYTYVENSSIITLNIGMRDISYSLDFNVYMEGYNDWGELPLRLSVSEIEDIGTISLKQNAPSQSLYFLDVLNERRIDLSQFYAYSLPANIRYKISDDPQNTKGTNEVYIEDGSNLVIKTLPKRGERYTVNIQAYDDVLKENNISNNNLTFTVTEVIELQALVDDITIYDLTINECNIDVSQYFNTYECNYAIQKYTCNGELINVNTNGAFITYTPNLQNTDYTITINSYYEEVSTSTKVENTNSSFTITFKELAPFDIDVPKTTLNKQTGWNVDHTETIPQSVSLNNIFTINHPNSNIDDLTVSSQTTNTTGKYTDFNLYTINNTTIDFQQDYRGDDTTVIFTATLSGYPDYSSNFSVVIPECNLPEIEVKNVGVGNSVVDIGLLYDDDCNVILSNLYDNTYPFSIKYSYEIETPTPIPEPDLSQSADKENLTIQSSTTFYNTQLTDPLEYNIRITAYDEITPSHSNRDVLLSVVQLPQLLLRDGQVSEINNADDGNYDINSRYNIGNNTSYSHLIQAYFVNEPSLAGFNSNDLYAWNTERDAIVISKDYRGGDYSNVLNVRYKSHIDLVGDTNITINVSEDKPVSVNNIFINSMKQSINNAVATNPESIYRYDLDTLNFVNHVDTGTNQTLLFSVSGNIKRSKYFYGGDYSNVQIVDGINSNILEIAPEYNGKYEVILSVMTSNVVYQTPDSRVLYIPIEIVESNLPDIEVLNANVNVSDKDYDLTNNIVYPFRDYINYTIRSVDSISTYDTSYGSFVDSFTINTANNINFEKTFKYPSGSFRNAQYTVNIQVDDPLATSIATSIATFALDVVELPAITFKSDDRDISINLSHLEFVKTVSITDSFLKIDGTPIYTYSRDHIGIRSHDLECNVVEIEYGSTTLHVYNEYRGGTSVPISVKVEGIEHSSVSFNVIINEPDLYQYVQDIDKDLGLFYNTVIPITNPIQYLIDYPFPHDLVVDTHPNAIIADDSTGSQSINIYIEDKLVGTSTLMTVSLNWEVGNKVDIEDNAEDNSVVVWVYDKVDDDNTNDTSTQI